MFVKETAGKFLDIYRLRHTEKISALRLAGYTVFGYAIGDIFHPAVLTLNFMAVTFFLMGASFFNDYYDWKLLGERNASARYRVDSILYGILPLAAVAVLLVVQYLIARAFASAIVLGASMVLGIVYSMPPVRLKNRNILNIVVPALGLYGLFLQALLLGSISNLFQWFVAAVVFLFAWYLEFLHIIDDAEYEHESFRISPQRAFIVLRFITICGVALSIVGIISGLQIAVISLFAWAMRARAVWHIQACDISKQRRFVFSSLWHLEEFAVYAVVGIVKMFP